MGSLWKQIEHTKKLWGSLQHAGVVVQLKKRSCFTNTIHYLYRAVQSKHLKIAIYTAEATEVLTLLTHIAVLRSLFEIYSDFRPFVPNLARMATVLCQKLKKNELTHFGTLHVDKLIAILALQDKLVLPPKFAIPYSGCNNMRYRCMQQTSEKGPQTRRT